MNELTVVEICAGAGGQALGLHRAGFTHKLAVEIDDSAAATLRHNLQLREGGSPDVRVGDVADRAIWDPQQFEGVDLFAGGVPCPPFSIAGRQLGSQDERDLFAWAVEQVGVIRPRALMLENVRGLSMPRFSGYRQAVADRLDELGYWSEWRLLHANNHGVVQLRPRFVLVAMSHEDAKHFHWPEETPTTRTVGTELHDLMAANGWKYADAWAEVANDIAPTVVGGSKKHGGADLGPTRAKRAWALLGVDGRGIADEAPRRSAHSFRTSLPRLTNEMVMRIQGWGSAGYEWEFLGRKTSVYRQIGNAFPPPVAEAVGRSIADALQHLGVQRELEKRRIHDELYSILKTADRPLNEAELLASLGEEVSLDLLDERVSALGRDFYVDVRVKRGERYFELGDFKAFRGQDDHLRHEAFAERESRARVS